MGAAELQSANSQRYALGEPLRSGTPGSIAALLICET